MHRALAAAYLPFPSRAFLEFCRSSILLASQGAFVLLLHLGACLQLSFNLICKISLIGYLPLFRIMNEVIK
jgi:hypothetical protein